MFDKVLKALEQLIELVKESQRDIRIPRQELGIMQALHQIRAVCDSNTYVQISPPDFNWWRADGEIGVGEWTVYDGGKHFSGATLADAVKKLLDAHRPDGEPDKLENVEAAIEGMMQPAESVTQF